MRAIVLALTCARAILRHPGFWVLLLVCLGLSALSRYFVLFGFGQTAGMLREVGLANVTLAGMVTVLLFGTGGMDQDSPGHREFLLSKPIGPAHYLASRYAGLILAVLAGQALILGFICGLLQAQGSGPLHTVVVGAFLSFVQVTILAAFAVSLSLFMPIFMNVSFLLVIYVAGHLAAQLRPAGYSARLVFGLIPNLENFNAGLAVARGLEVPLHVLALDAAYGVVYTLLVLSAAVAMSARWQAEPR